MPLRFAVTVVNYQHAAVFYGFDTAGVDMLNIANDHALDGLFGELTATMANLQAAGMDYVGGAASPEEKATPKIVEINGIK
nr:CapA family protein [Clostridia bacterium]